MSDERPITPDPNEAIPAVPAVPGAEIVDVPPSDVVTTVAATGPSRQRWVVAAVVAAVVLAASALLAGLLAGRAIPEVLRYVSADALIVVELRPELPGDQRAKVGELLSHFPGFKDQSTLDQKIDESLDLLVDRLSSGETDYTTEIKPYLAGPAVLAVLAPTTATDPDPRFVFVASTDGTTECRLPHDLATHLETYEGLEIHVPDDGMPASCALDGRNAIIGSLDDVKTAIDTKRRGGSIADNASYRAAQAELEGDHLSAVFVNARALIEQAMAMSPEASAVATTPAIDDLPAWFAAQVRAEDDALTLTGVAPLPDTFPAPPGPDHVSGLAERIPATAIAAFEARDLGATIKSGLDQLAENPDTAEVAQQLESALATIGGIDALTGWMGDLAVVATVDGETIGGGLLLEANDEAAAAATLASIRNLIVLAGTGSEIHLDQVDHDGTTIYVVDLGDFGEILGMPVAVGGTDGTRLALSFAQRDDLVVVGVDQAFVEAVLDTQDGASLADNPRYQHAIERAGKTNSGQGYVDLAAVLEYARTEMTGDAAANWDANIKPWISPFEGVALSAIRDGDHMRGHVVITVR
jgi:uncharacterized protein DUF3352